MARAEQIASRISHLLARSGGSLPTEAAELAQEYAAAVDEVNRRLDQCVSLVRRGLRSEGIHQAEIAPPVLEEAAALAFPGWSEWVQLCAARGWGPVPAIDEQAVIEIDEAFPVEQQMESLLRTHRRLALARAPLRARIKLLRRLSQADVGNPIWGEDLVGFERARHKQIAVEARAAGGRGDLATLESLQRECRELWLEAPSPTLQRHLDALVKAARAAATRRTIAALDEQIRQAYQQRDMTQAAPLLAQRAEAAGELGETQDALDPIVAEAAAWAAQAEAQAAQERQFKSALAALEQGLDDRVAVEELERRWAAVASHDRTVPQVLRSRYQARLAEQQLAASRRFRLKTLAAVGVLVIVGGMVGFFVYQGVTSRRVERWHGQVQQLIEQQAWPQAAALLDQLQAEHAAVYQTPQLQALVLEVARQREAEQQRHIRLAAALEAVAAAGVDHPDRDALAQAEALAQSDEEKARVEALRLRIQQADLVRQRVQDETFSVTLDDLRRRFAEVRPLAMKRDAEALTALRQVQADLSKLLRLAGVSPALRSSGEAVLTSVNTLERSLSEELERQRSALAAVQHMEGLIHRPVSLAVALRAFAQTEPQHPWAEAFRRSAELEGAWQTVLAWNKQVGGVGDVLARDPGEVARLVAVLGEFEAAHPDSGFSAAIEEYGAYLERAVAALDPASDPALPTSEVGALLALPIVDNLQCFTIDGGRLLYTHMKEPPRSWGGEDSVLAKFITRSGQAFGYERPEERALSRASFGDQLAPKPAPQSLFAQATRRWLQAHRAEWETLHLGLAERLANAEEIDPVLRAILMTQFLELGQTRGWVTHPDLTAWTRSLKALDTDVAWMDPWDPAADAAREAAAVVLSAPPHFAQIRTGFDTWRARMAHALGRRRTAGVLWRRIEDGAAALGAAADADALVDGPLEVVERSGEGWRFVQVGWVRNGEVAWEITVNRIPAGSLVYQVERPAQEAR